MGGKEQIKVWDIGVRLFHWSLVTLFALAYVSGEMEGSVHAAAGYAVLALLAFRLPWGFIGPRHARFADFVYGAAATLRYARSLFARRPLHYLGHNPLGGWMVIALLLALAGTCWTGLEAYGAQGHGPLAGAGPALIAPALANGDYSGGRHKRGPRKAKGDEFWEDVHEALSHLTLFLVLLHVAGALVASALHRENLVKAMITGYKRHGEPPA